MTTGVASGLDFAMESLHQNGLGDNRHDIVHKKNRQHIVHSLIYLSSALK